MDERLALPIKKMTEHNNIEIIDLDPEEPNIIKNEHRDGVVPKQKKLVFRTDKNSVVASSSKIVHQTISEKDKKTLALIPVDYLKYCNVKNGKFMVKLDTLNKLKTKNSVYLYNVPKEQNPNSLTKVKNIIKMSENSRVQPSSLPSSFVKILPKASSSNMPAKLSYITETSKKTLNTNKNETTQKKNLTTNFSKTCTNLSSVKPPKFMSKILLNSPSISPIKNNELTSYEKEKTTKNIEKAPIKNYFVRNIIAPVQSTQNLKGDNITSNKTISPIASTSTPIKTFRLKSQIEVVEKLNKLKNPQADILERDPLELPIDPLSNYPTFSNPPPLIPYKNNMERSSKKIVRKKPGSETDSVEESQSFSSLFDSNYSLLNDPLAEVPFSNIFEPIITLDETDNKPNNKTLESSLTEGLKGDGISDQQLAELEKMITQNSVKSPLTVKIPAKFLKYCTKKNGKYMIDINALKKINLEKKGLIEKKMEKDREITATKREIDVLKTKLSQKKQKQKVTLEKAKATLQNNNETQKKVKNSNISKKLMIFQKPTQGSLEQRRTYANNITVIEQGATSSDKCRHLFLKSSAWGLIDPESNICKGFNERELNISRTCLKHFREFLDAARKDCKILHNNFFKSDFGENNNEDLYFTKKIDILDLRGRKIRTEHVKQRIISRTEFLLRKMKKCSVKIKRNRKVEEAVEMLIRYEKLRRNLESKLITSGSALQLKRNKPLLILNENNLDCLKLTEVLCLRTNMIFIKTPNRHLSKDVCNNLFFVEMVERNLIKIITPKVLQNFFANKKVLETF